MMKKMKAAALLTMCFLLTVFCFAAPACAEADLPEAPAAEPVPVDLDLTGMSETMVYGIMYEMVNAPKNYVGQRIKFNGTYSSFKDAVTGEVEHTITVYDSSYCCMVDVNFVLEGEHEYPKDYPRSGSKMTIVGELCMEQEGKETTCWIGNGVLE